MTATFRRAEVSAVVRCFGAGDSCSLVAVSGMGKSNLFRHLLDAATRRHYLGAGWENYVFLGADCHALGELSEEAVYDLLLALLVEGCEGAVGGETASRLHALRERAQASPGPLQAKRSFVEAVRALMRTHEALRLVVLFDQFEDIYAGLPSRFFTVLRSVRDEHKYRLSYMALTREELPYIKSGPDYEEFYELFSANVIGLGPYDDKDALDLLARVAGRYGQELPGEVCERLISLTGAHPGLMKAACMALLKGGALPAPGGRDLAAALLDVYDVANECAKLAGSISAEEREAVYALARGAGRELEAEVGRRLRLKRLVREDGEAARIFSPLFAEYAARQKFGHAAGTKVRVGPLRIDSAGEVWVDGRLVSPALSKKELLLLEFLCLEPGALRTRDEIIAVVYPDEYRSGSMVSEDAVNALVKRLRTRLGEALRGHDCVVAVRGKGYRLALDRLVGAGQSKRIPAIESNDTSG